MFCKYNLLIFVYVVRCGLEIGWWMSNVYLYILYLLKFCGIMFDKYDKYFYEKECILNNVGIKLF